LEIEALPVNNLPTFCVMLMLNWVNSNVAEDVVVEGCQYISILGTYIHLL